MNHALKEVVESRVELALSHHFRCELGDPGTGHPMSSDQRREALTALFWEVAKAMGAERFAETPVERLDQFAVMSVVNNHDTGGLLRSLVNSFMIAYSTPETTDRAFKALLSLEALRAEVAEARGQPSKNLMLRDAALDLDADLSKKMPQHSAASPLFRILIGPDRIFVMSPKPIKDLPKEFNGVLVEAMFDSDLKAVAQ